MSDELPCQWPLDRPGECAYVYLSSDGMEALVSMAS